MMKMIKFGSVLMTAALLGGAATSCSPDYETDFEVKELNVPHSDRATLHLNKELETREIKVETNVPTSEWVATSNAEAWCTVEKSEGKVTVTAQPNNTFKTRLAMVTIAYGHQKFDIRVKQYGVENIFHLDMSKVDENGNKVIEEQEDANKKMFFQQLVSAQKSEVVVPFVSNLKLDRISIPDTVKWVTIPENAVVTQEGKNTAEIHFNLVPNTNLSVRYCTVTFQSSDNFNKDVTLVLKQTARGYVVVKGDELKDSYEVDYIGGTVTLPFKSNHADKWEVVIPEEAQSWISVASGARAADLQDRSVRLEVKPNLNDAREATVKIVNKDNDSETTEIPVTINQKKYVDVIPNPVVNLTATAGEHGSITLNWEAPEDVNYAYIRVAYRDNVFNKDVVKELGSDATSFVVNPTFAKSGEYEFTVTTLSPKKTATPEPQKVKASSNSWIGERKPEAIPLTVEMITANNSHKGGSDAAAPNGLGGLIDDNPDSFYHTSWNTNAPGNKPHFLQFALGEPISNLTIECLGRKHDNSRTHDIKTADIYVATEDSVVGDVTPASWDNGKWTKVGTLEFDLSNNNVEGRVYSATNAVELGGKVKHIRFVPTLYRNGDIPTGASNRWWNMAKLSLFECYDEDWIVANIDTAKEMFYPAGN